jgi:hypothetical protein
MNNLRDPLPGEANISPTKRTTIIESDLEVDRGNAETSFAMRTIQNDFISFVGNDRFFQFVTHESPFRIFGENQQTLL